MQVAERTQRQLAGDVKELKDHLVILDDEEILKSQIKRDPTWKEVLMGYKGKATSQTKRNQRIRKDLTDFLKKLGV